MPFKPKAAPDDYPERNGSGKRGWDYWAAEQKKNLRKAIGDELYEWLLVKGNERRKGDS